MVKREVKEHRRQGDGQYRHQIAGAAGQQGAEAQAADAAPVGDFHGDPSLPRHDPSVLDADDAVGHLGDFLIVGNHHHGLGELLTRHLHEPQHILAGFAVQVAGGLVSQKNGGLGGQGPGDGHPLLLAAGELVGRLGSFFSSPRVAMTSCT